MLHKYNQLNFWLLCIWFPKSILDVGLDEINSWNWCDGARAHGVKLRTIVDNRDKETPQIFTFYKWTSFAITCVLIKLVFWFVFIFFNTHSFTHFKSLSLQTLRISAFFKFAFLLRMIIGYQK